MRCSIDVRESLSRSIWESQLAVLEEPLPEEGITLQIELGVDEIVEEIVQRLPEK